jgi:hypothetical protein
MAASEFNAQLQEPDSMRLMRIINRNELVFLDCFMIGGLYDDCRSTPRGFPFRLPGATCSWNSIASAIDPDYMPLSL